MGGRDKSNKKQIDVTFYFVTFIIIYTQGLRSEGIKRVLNRLLAKIETLILLEQLDFKSLTKILVF